MPDPRDEGQEPCEHDGPGYPHCEDCYAETWNFKGLGLALVRAEAKEARRARG